MRRGLFGRHDEFVAAMDNPVLGPQSFQKIAIFDCLDDCVNRIADEVGALFASAALHRCSSTLLVLDCLSSLVLLSNHRSPT